VINAQHKGLAKTKFWLITTSSSAQELHARDAPVHARMAKPGYGCFDLLTTAQMRSGDFSAGSIRLEDSCPFCQLFFLNQD
jgi:hypothetical protein